MCVLKRDETEILVSNFYLAQKLMGRWKQLIITLKSLNICTHLHVGVSTDIQTV